MVMDGFDAKFLKYPVKFVQAMPHAPAAGTIPVFLGTANKAIYWGTRRGVTIGVDRSVFFTSDAVAVKGTQRIAITVENQDAERAGPMVGLELAGG